ncbi:MAG: hypothetical protein QXG25_00220 [Nitrososphaerota archaeon]
MSGISWDELLKLIYCCGVLEDQVSEAYRHMAGRAEDPILKAVLNYVSSDSRKHSEVLKNIALALGAGMPSFDECKRVAGELWAQTMRGVERELEQTDKLSRKDLAFMIESLAELESAVMEEYLMMLQAEAIKMLLEAKPEARLLKMIIEWIAEDEKRHVQILEALRSK